jgi:hypothetical protein
MFNMWLQTLKFIAKKSKCASLAHEIGFSAPNLWNLLRLVKGATQLCTSKKECNKLDLTAAQYFWLVDHHDWSRWFVISGPMKMEFETQFYWWGCPKKTARLRHVIYYPELHTEHWWRCSNNQKMLGPVNVIQIQCAWKADKMEIPVFYLANHNEWSKWWHLNSLALCPLHFSVCR